MFDSPRRIDSLKKSELTHIAQNIAKRSQEYFLYFIAIEILSLHFFLNITKYFIATLQFQLSEIFFENEYIFN